LNLSYAPLSNSRDGLSQLNNYTFINVWVYLNTIWLK